MFFFTSVSSSTDGPFLKEAGRKDGKWEKGPRERGEKLVFMVGSCWSG